MLVKTHNIGEDRYDERSEDQQRIKFLALVPGMKTKVSYFGYRKRYLDVSKR